MCTKCRQYKERVCLSGRGTEYAWCHIRGFWKNRTMQLLHFSITNIYSAICHGIQGKFETTILLYNICIESSPSCFQKESPYIKEVNKQLQILVEMGLINKWVRESVGNATKCDTLEKMIDSKVEPLTILNLSHVGSCFVLAIAGSVTAIIAFICEFIIRKSFRSNVNDTDEGTFFQQGYYSRSRPIRY